MIGEVYEQDIVAFALFGIIVNFLFSFLFGWYLTRNIGLEEMVTSRGTKQQSWLAGVSLAIPFAKMVLTLYRAAILQLYFLNQGLSHKDFWIYMTSDESEQY